MLAKSFKYKRIKIEKMVNFASIKNDENEEFEIENNNELLYLSKHTNN
jgi:hypothetical protein